LNPEPGIREARYNESSAEGAALATRPRPTDVEPLSAIFLLSDIDHRRARTALHRRRHHLQMAMSRSSRDGMVARWRESLSNRARAIPLARHAWARYRRRRYERRIQRFLDEKSGRADRLPIGAVYEATMRCNLHCEFCYVGDLLNIEGEWRQEMTLEALQRAFPHEAGFQIRLTGGEIFMRKDIMSVLDLFREKGYACGYLTTNGTIITEERAEALAALAADGFLRHISVSIDGPGDLHDAARGQTGTFTRTCAGLRRLQDAARRRQAKLRISINTTVAHESLDALDQMVDVAGELGVDAIGLNHLMFSTPEEVAETVRMIGADDASVIATFVTPDPGVDANLVRQKVGALQAKCRERNVLFDYRPKVHPPLIDNYYTPGTRLNGRCLYPFLHARISFSGKVYFCPFIRVEVGDLAKSTLEEIWNSDRYVDMRRRLVENGIFPVCRRCCKVELSPEPVAVSSDAPARGRKAIPLTVVR
jgi:MoaA/NifB/PqqE/SkfB family radical SAM enzyme